MTYDPIKLELNKDSIDFYFDRPYGKHWFYQVHSVWNRKELEDWDEHLKEKMWYTPEIRKETLELMEKIIETK